MSSTGYLKGKAPPAFDLLFWNGDDTNLPGPMFCWYLRNTYLENKLREPGATVQCGVPVDLGAVEVPAFLYASREDHIVPWQTAYKSTELLGGDLTFVLGASGHIAGVINPPAKKKRNYWVGKIEPDAGLWLEHARSEPGSWWPVWAGWLEQHAGALVPAPKSAGNRKFPVIEPAPGRYVKRKGRVSPENLSFALMENFMEDIVIVAATRTAVGKFGGTLAKTPAPDLGAAVVVELLKRARLSGEQIGELIFGQVLTAGAGQNPARQTVIKSGLPVTVPALTINAVCGSGLKAVMLAAQAVRDGDPRSSSPAARRA